MLTCRICKMLCTVLGNDKRRVTKCTEWNNSVLKYLLIFIKFNTRLYTSTTSSLPISDNLTYSGASFIRHRMSYRKTSYK